MCASLSGFPTEGAWFSAHREGAPHACEGRDLSDDTEDMIAETETLPLDAWHRRKGARMVPFAG